MSRALRVTALVSVIFVIGAAPFLRAQGQKTDVPPEATASVPALDSFHEVIREIWHDAWPGKDTALLRKLQPEVEKGISEVAAAPLPGILREKKAAWQSSVKKLEAIGAEYRTAARGNDDAGLLAAAEKLHSQYEALVRVTRPALRELDAFHSSLYMLYHHYLPAFDQTKIKSSAAELKQKMADLNRATLPERLKTRETVFTPARARLSAAVDELVTVVTGPADRKNVEQAVEKVHSAYEALNAVFE